MTLEVSRSANSLRRLAYVSGIYDLCLALPLLAAPGAVASAFGAPAPVPEINARLNGLFTLALALGYLWAAREVLARRGYLWVAGVFTKGVGALLFLVDHFAAGSPFAFLLFSATDGTLALVTLWLLLRSRSAAVG